MSKSVIAGLPADRAAVPVLYFLSTLEVYQYRRYITKRFYTTDDFTSFIVNRSGSNLGWNSTAILA